MSSVAILVQGIFGSDAPNHAAHPPTLGQAHLTKQRHLCLRECMADAFAEKTFTPIPRTLANLTLGFPQGTKPEIHDTICDSIVESCDPP